LRRGPLSSPHVKKSVQKWGQCLLSSISGPQKRANVSLDQKSVVGNRFSKDISLGKKKATSSHNEGRRSGGGKVSQREVFRNSLVKVEGTLGGWHCRRKKQHPTRGGWRFENWKGHEWGLSRSKEKTTGTSLQTDTDPGKKPRVGGGKKRKRPPVWWGKNDSFVRLSTPRGGGPGNVKIQSFSAHTTRKKHFLQGYLNKTKKGLQRKK